MTVTFEAEDLLQLEEAGISPEEARRQVSIFAERRRFRELVRPCRVGDGIRSVDPAYPLPPAGYEEARRRGRLQRFVPASGAATRMFQALLWVRGESPDVTRGDLQEKAKQGVENAREVLRTLDALPRLPFFDDLHAVVPRGVDGSVGDIARAIVGDEGLGYAGLPKGLVKFHRYPEESRTPFEEHLVEAAAYVRDGQGRVRVHFTVSPEHLASFHSLLERVGSRYERRYDVRFEVTFSTQKRATDTLAVDPENQPFRRADGRLLLRPGGHGALIENLNDLQADIVHIQNIDNIVPDRWREEVVHWKRLLVGELLRVQQRLFEHVRTLQGDASDETVRSAASFAAEVLNVAIPPQHVHGGVSERAFLLEKFHRPLRVCGMVPNTGEPGGGPFWVRDPAGDMSLQIVEGAEVDPTSPEQQSIYASSSHFNPVHLVCGVRDHRGALFDLRTFVDPSAVFIAQKSSEGRPLKALERPGLWNGAMAGWNTVFVEIPGINFTPVKTVNDLLRPEHQEDGQGA